MSAVPTNGSKQGWSHQWPASWLCERDRRGDALPGSICCYLIFWENSLSSSTGMSIQCVAIWNVSRPYATPDSPLVVRKAEHFILCYGRIYLTAWLHCTLTLWIYKSQDQQRFAKDLACKLFSSQFLEEGVSLLRVSDAIDAKSCPANPRLTNSMNKWLVLCCCWFDLLKRLLLLVHKIQIKVRQYWRLSWFTRYWKRAIMELQNMGYSYLQRRGELVANILSQSITFGLREEVAHDAILLMDRIMSASVQVSTFTSSPLTSFS